MRTVPLAGGKYTFVYDEETGKLECLRYGEPWRDFVGDKAVLELFFRVTELTDAVKDALNVFQDVNSRDAADRMRAVLATAPPKEKP